MALVLADRVKETCTSPGTGSVTLQGAVSGYQSFSSGIGANNTTYYVIADQQGTNWEVGLGTLGSTGTTLARTTVIASSNGGNLVAFSTGTQNVFVDYPAEKSVYLNASGAIGPLGTITSATWQATTIAVAYGGTGLTSFGSGGSIYSATGASLNVGTLPVAYGGTGVTVSSGANSVVLRDSNQNISYNNETFGFTAYTTSGGTTTLTAASPYYNRFNGSSNQIVVMPDQTTIGAGTGYLIDNDSTGSLTVKDAAGTTIQTVIAGGLGYIYSTSNASIGGNWGVYALLPGNVQWGTSAVNMAGAVISNATWNGSVIANTYGGTGQNSSAWSGLVKTTAGVWSVAVSGTDYAPATSGSSILYGNGSGGFSAVTIGTGLSFTGGTLSFTGPSGTVTTMSVVSANGFAGTVANATSTPAITLSTTVTGLLKGNGTALSAATVGTDYSAGTASLATGLLKSTTTTGALSIASSGIDYAPPTSGTSILYGNGSGGYSNVTVGSGLSFTGGTLSATGSGSGSMTLLGTLTTTSGTSQTLSGLTLTGYKQLLCVITNIAYATGDTINFGTATLKSGGGSGNMYGQFWVDLTNGYTAPILTTNQGPSATGYNTSSTSVTITKTNAFTTGSLQVYGIK